MFGQEERLSAPTGLDASDGAYVSRVGLAWEHVRHAAEYAVWRSDSSNPAKAVTIGRTPSLIFYDNRAEPNRRYHYWIQARAAGLSSPLSQPETGFSGSAGEKLSGDLVPLRPPLAPKSNPLTGAKIYLGKALFWEEQLSSTRTVACGTCHQPSAGGSDSRSYMMNTESTHPGVDGDFFTPDDAIGSAGVPLNLPDGSYGWSPLFGLRPQVTPRQAPSMINAAYADVLFWDGRAHQSLVDPVSGDVIIESGAALENQALHPLVDPSEMAASGDTWQAVLRRVREASPLALSPSIPAALKTWIGGRSYPQLFEEAFGTSEVSAPRIAMAIASYERTLFSDRTPFAAAVSGIRRMGEAERRGFGVFQDHGCNRCHQGSRLAENKFRNLGLSPHAHDEGRYRVTGRKEDLGSFRTPSLLNVALRAPFAHNGRFDSLEEVIELYDRGGDVAADNRAEEIVVLDLDDRERSDLRAFLAKALTDPRVASESGPLFDRPRLYSESKRVPKVVDEGKAGSGAKMPYAVALEPPFAGNPSFTVGLTGALPGAQATLVIDEALPPLDSVIPGSGSFVHRTVTVQPPGFASVSCTIPDDPKLVGKVLFGRWYIRDSGAEKKFAATSAFRFAVFRP